MGANVGYFLNRHMAMFTTILVLFFVTLLVAATALHPFGIEFKKEVDITLFVVTAGFAITIVQLNQSMALQRGGFIKDHVAQFFTRPELYATWHDLVYNYEDDLFTKVDEYVQKHHLADQPERPIPLSLDRIEMSTAERSKWAGIRIYHPAVFQGSTEEKQLDALLGYLDVVGFYCESGLISINDVAASLGYFLAHMGKRRVIEAYLKLTEDAWKKPEYRRITPDPPFVYTRKLFKSLASLNDARLAKLSAPMLGSAAG